MDDIKNELFKLQDLKYREFSIKLIPTVNPDAVIGVRTPVLREFAKKITHNEKDVALFLNQLPHRFYDENQLHAFILSEIKDFDLCIKEVSRFLPYIDNWATCDQMSPKVFHKHRAELLNYIMIWIKSNHVFTVRFAIGMLMQHYLEDDFDIKYPQDVAMIRSDEYYINMMIAWYFATALTKQYETIIPFLENKYLMPWTHNKAIQKAIESYRISDSQKQYLKTLKINMKKFSKL